MVDGGTPRWSRQSFSFLRRGKEGSPEERIKDREEGMGVEDEELDGVDDKYLELTSLRRRARFSVATGLGISWRWSSWVGGGGMEGGS